MSLVAAGMIVRKQGFSMVMARRVSISIGGLLALLLLFVALPIVAAATPAPVAAPAAGPPKAPAKAELPLCARARAAGVPMSALSVDQQWQPRGGRTSFSIRQPSGFPPNAIIRVCYGWKVIGQSTAYMESEAVALSSIGADGSLHAGAQVPYLEPAHRYSGWWGQSGDSVYESFFVPVAGMRVFVLKGDGTVLADESTAIGITRDWVSMLLAVGFPTVFILLLANALRRCNPVLDVPDPLLRIISTKNGYASLSQFQIMLWTVVVGASIIYVMSLSGRLITISDGTLVLLGISGTATLASKLQSAKADAEHPEFVAARAAQAPHVPQWQDLVYADGEIDVSRVQMLFFTLISAVFVLIKVIAGFEIPDIPTNVQLLMGISNGVYLGSKFAGAPKPQDANAKTATEPAKSSAPSAVLAGQPVGGLAPAE